LNRHRHQFAEARASAHLFL